MASFIIVDRKPPSKDHPCTPFMLPSCSTLAPSPPLPPSPSLVMQVNVEMKELIDSLVEEVKAEESRAAAAAEAAAAAGAGEGSKEGGQGEGDADEPEEGGDGEEGEGLGGGEGEENDDNDVQEVVKGGKKGTDVGASKGAGSDTGARKKNQKPRQGGGGGAEGQKSAQPPAAAAAASSGRTSMAAVLQRELFASAEGQGEGTAGASSVQAATGGGATKAKASHAGDGTKAGSLKRRNEAGALNPKSVPEGVTGNGGLAEAGDQRDGERGDKEAGTVTKGVQVSKENGAKTEEVEEVVEVNGAGEGKSVEETVEEAIKRLSEEYSDYDESLLRSMLVSE